MKKLSILCVLICLLFLSSCDGLTPMLLNDIESLDNLENVFAEIDDGLSYSEAKEQGGFFVMEDENKFVPLEEDMKFFIDHSFNDNIFFTDAESEKIPKVGKAEKIVLFSNKLIKDKYWFVPIQDEGYTIPFEFYYASEGVCITGLEFKQESNYDDYQVENVCLKYTGYTNKEFRKAVDYINEKIAKESYDSDMVFPEKLCPHGLPCSNINVFRGKKYLETVTIAFYAGTSYCEETFYADLKYYVFDGCEKKDKRIPPQIYYSGTAITPEFTKEGYVIFDTSSFENGKYVIANLNERVIFEISR